MWLPVAPESHFSIHNIPFGVFSTASNQNLRCGTRVGDFVIDLQKLYDAGLLQNLGLQTNVFAESKLNGFMKHTKPVWRSTRGRIQQLFNGGDDALKNDESLRQTCIIPKEEVTMHLPAEVVEYTDFYSSKEHATNIGIMLRGAENALQPNWLHLPVGYHGRASSVVVSGTNLHRPCGQLQKDPTNPKAGSIFHPCRALDFELEMGYFLGGETNALGTPVDITEAEDRIFGMVLLNDWSARDLQAWEYVPLGPFTAKNFGTSISPWIVTMDALEPFRCETSAGPVQDDPLPLQYLLDANYHQSSYDINLEVAIRGPQDDQDHTSVISKSNFKYLYWNIKQQLVHHSVSGASMRAGDLLGTGTISGTTPDSYGSMMELSWKGSKEIPLTNTSNTGNDKRKYLQDGDTVIMSGCARRGDQVVGFCEVSGTILPAHSKYL